MISQLLQINSSQPLSLCEILIAEARKILLIIILKRKNLNSSLLLLLLKFFFYFFLDYYCSINFTLASLLCN